MTPFFSVWLCTSVNITHQTPRKTPLPNTRDSIFSILHGDSMNTHTRAPSILYDLASSVRASPVRSDSYGKALTFDSTSHSSGRPLVSAAAG